MSWRTKVLEGDSGQFRVRFRVWQFGRSRSNFEMLILNVNGVIFLVAKVKPSDIEKSMSIRDGPFHS